MKNPFIKSTPEIPARCPECGYPYRALSDHINHSPTCSRIDLDSARHYLRRHQEEFKTAAVRMARSYERQCFWEGRFHVLRHENNRLRKENVALKLSGQPPKEPAP